MADDFLGKLGRLVTEHELDNRKFKQGLRDSMRADEEAHSQIQGNQKTTSSLTEKIKDGFKFAAGKVKDFVVSVVESSTIVQMAKETISGFIEALIAIPFMWLIDNWANLVEGVKKWASETWESIKDWVASVAEWFGISADNVHAFFESLETAWNNFWDWMNQGWMNSWAAIQEGLPGIANSIWSWLTSVKDIIIGPFESLQSRDWGADWNNFWSAISSVQTTIENWDWGDAWDNFKKQMGFDSEKDWTFADNWLMGLAGSINDFMGGAGNNLRNWAKGVAEDIGKFDEKTQSLKDAWDGFVSTITGLATGDTDD